MESCWINGAWIKKHLFLKRSPKMNQNYQILDILLTLSFQMIQFLVPADLAKKSFPTVAPASMERVLPGPGGAVGAPLAVVHRAVGPRVGAEAALLALAEAPGKAWAKQKWDWYSDDVCYSNYFIAWLLGLSWNLLTVHFVTHPHIFPPTMPSGRIHPPSSPLPSLPGGHTGTGPRSTRPHPGSDRPRSHAPGRAATARCSCRHRCVWCDPNRERGRCLGEKVKDDGFKGWVNRKHSNHLWLAIFGDGTPDFSWWSVDFLDPEELLKTTNPAHNFLRWGTPLAHILCAVGPHLWRAAISWFSMFSQTSLNQKRQRTQNMRQNIAKYGNIWQNDMTTKWSKWPNPDITWWTPQKSLPISSTKTTSTHHHISTPHLFPKAMPRSLQPLAVVDGARLELVAEVLGLRFVLQRWRLTRLAIEVPGGKSTFGTLEIRRQKNGLNTSHMYTKSNTFRRQTDSNSIWNPMIFATRHELHLQQVLQLSQFLWARVRQHAPVHRLAGGA